MKPLRHTMILASAGSGKTHALTTRYVALLARGMEPERIIALTFTRKAAGEFFEEILNKLAKAASSDTEAARLAGAIGSQSHRRTDFLVMLRSVVDAMPRLSLGTLDGFFARIVRSFPLELGLSGGFEILQEHSARRARRRVLRSLFTVAGERTRQQADFVEAFKRATYGLQEKQLAGRLDSFLDEHAETFLAAPEPEAWASPRRIWPGGCDWLESAVVSREEGEAALRGALPWNTLSEEQRKRFTDFFAEWKTWRAGAPLSKPFLYLLENAFAAWDDLKAGSGRVVIERKKVALSPDAARILRGILVAIGREEMLRHLEITRGLYDVLRGYERVYHETVRRGGRLTFADVQRLLLPGAGAPRLQSGGSGETREELRLAIDWRLDAQFDHWLLDEFQDTSFGQWSILRNLIDEAVQDPEGRRSFFYVGDVKQAIFSWREGDPRLFREIFDHYNAAHPGVIEELQLNQSWRSGPDVIALVNRVFGDPRALSTVVPVATAEAWGREWREHTSAHTDQEGYAEVRVADDKEKRYQEALGILREVDPLGRGLSVALLVQKNETAAELASFLRTQGGLRAVAESDITVCTDNPVGAALLALVRAAAFPGDSLAWEHVKMTPLAEVLAGRGIHAPEDLSLRLLSDVSQRGFAGGMEPWISELEKRLDAGDDFSRGRARDWFEAAHVFDETGSRDFAEFLEFAGRHTKREGDSASVIRVMTIHKAKGLGFDLVILPDLEGRHLVQRRSGLAVKKAADRSVEWILDPPSRVFADRDPVLSAWLTSAEEEAAYESLCLLYVAMTRAKRAMYLIVEPVGNSKARTYPQMLRAAVGETFAVGETQWFLRCGHGVPAVSGKDELEPWIRHEESSRPGRGRAQLRVRTPSDTERGSMAASALLDLEVRRQADHGTAVHSLLAAVEWSDEPWKDRVATTLVPEDIGVAVRAEMLACMDAPTLSEVFRKPTVSPGANAWRERAFEVVIEGTWLSGVFDRVVVERDDKGRAIRVRVWDFKTDRVANRGEAHLAARRYAGQMELYRKAAARLCGVPIGEVTAALVFTKIREVVGLAELQSGGNEVRGAGN
ncbi:MAG: UvrD-helicase domain-containing protein [Opitutaceae bacterium]|nr:UvrD-helicase domain-containing protein [Opitutaceae bacterium]